MMIRLQDARRHVFFIGFLESISEPVALLRNFMLQVFAPQVLSWVLGVNGWVMSKAASAHPDIMQAILYIARWELGLYRCFGARLGRGSCTVSGFYGAQRTITFWWPASSPALYSSIEHESSLSCDLKALFAGLDQSDVCWIQFFAASTREARKLRKHCPEMMLLCDDPDDDESNSQHDDDRSTIIADLPSPRHDPTDSDLTSHRTGMSTVRESMSTVRTPSSTARVPMSTTREFMQTRSKAVPSVPPLPPPAHWPPVPMQPPSGSRSHSDASLPQGSRSRSDAPTSRQDSIPSGSRSHSDQSQHVPHGSRSHSDRSQSIDSRITGTRQPHGSRSHSDRSISVDSRITGTRSPFVTGDEGAPAHLPATPVATARAGVTRSAPSTGNSVPRTPDKRARFEEPSASSAQVLPAVAPMHTTHSSHADDEYSDDEDIDYTFWYKTYTSVDGTVLDVLIKKDYDELTKDDVLKHWTKVEASMFDELNSFTLLAAIKIGLTGETGNVMTSRWVLKFKKKDDQRVIKARLCVHGFKDKDSETLSTFASTATKWTQRLVTATAAQQGWLICSADVSSAFIRGLTFEQMSKLTGHEVRTAAFSVPKNTIDIVRRLEGFSHYDPDVHEIVMCKPIYGLKDAPRAWRQRLHLALYELQGRSLATDNSLYVWHRVVPPLVAPSLVLMCSTHVDDLKITGTPSDVEFLLGGLAKMFGNLTIHRGIFTYCGIEHEQQKDFNVVTHQSP